MANLSIAARTQIWRGLMRWWSDRRIEIGDVSKKDLYDSSLNTGAVADADAWLDSAAGDSAPATGYNGALSEPFKTEASTLMKAELLLIVTSVRAEVAAGLPLGDYARHIMGVEVD